MKKYKINRLFYFFSIFLFFFLIILGNIYTAISISNLIMAFIVFFIVAIFIFLYWNLSYFSVKYILYDKPNEQLIFISLFKKISVKIKNINAINKKYFDQIIVFILKNGKKIKILNAVNGNKELMQLIKSKNPDILFYKDF